MFGWFFKNKEVEKIKEDTKKSFDSVKNDIHNVSHWIKHLDVEKNRQDSELSDIKEDLSSIISEIDNLKNMVSLLGNLDNQKKVRQPTKLSNKQTTVYAVQTDVETDVETYNLDNFSVTERAILWILLNTDMKLSYEDLAAMMGKEKSTIRSQINMIKQKSEIIQEIIEKNGKKRVFIPEEIKEKVLKKQKVRVKSSKKSKKK